MRTTGTLQVNASIVQEWSMSRDACPPGTPSVAECVRTVGEGLVAGLGRVRVTYEKVIHRDDPTCFIVHHNAAVNRGRRQGHAPAVEVRA